jgi:hypothetical protein
MAATASIIAGTAQRFRERGVGRADLSGVQIISKCAAGGDRDYILDALREPLDVHQTGQCLTVSVEMV